ncbi:phage tail protein [Ralstonia sp. UBA689]|uniref:phage tail protein n=1 Tax=Ralstonia sp. UBA689 TaxID=1947373 RepID=UPI0025E2FC31|nr:tail fiber protein [Ralstonia sp. UBA689]
MAEYFLGQVMLTGFGFAQRGFALCNGQLMAINQNTALFSLLGTQFGGDGRSTFGLPDLRGRTPIGAGPSADPQWQPAPYQVGTQAGAETVTLTQAQLPAHLHSLNATTVAGNRRAPIGSIYGSFANEALYAGTNPSLVPLNPAQLQNAGASQAHSNMQPFRTINFNIALTGVYPSRG